MGHRNLRAKQITAPDTSVEQQNGRQQGHQAWMATSEHATAPAPRITASDRRSKSLAAASMGDHRAPPSPSGRGGSSPWRRVASQRNTSLAAVCGSDSGPRPVAAMRTHCITVNGCWGAGSSKPAGTKGLQDDDATAVSLLERQQSSAAQTGHQAVSAAHRAGHATHELPCGEHKAVLQARSQPQDSARGL
jgi:hypothetical protein